MMKTCLFFCISIFTLSCQSTPPNDSKSRERIIETLENETKFFCERNLEKWQVQWSHQAFTSKMYAGATEFEELIGWNEINEFTVRHIKENPESIPIPKAHFDYDVHLFDRTALVFYYKEVNSHLIREVRFMVKEGEKWKIARMQTIY